MNNFLTKTPKEIEDWIDSFGLYGENKKYSSASPLEEKVIFSAKALLSHIQGLIQLQENNEVFRAKYYGSYVRRAHIMELQFHIEASFRRHLTDKDISHLRKKSGRKQLNYEEIKNYLVPIIWNESKAIEIKSLLSFIQRRRNLAHSGFAYPKNESPSYKPFSSLAKRKIVLTKHDECGGVMSQPEDMVPLLDDCLVMAKQFDNYFKNK